MTTFDHRGVTMMPDRDKVTKGLKACADGECTNCPYDKGAALMTTCTGKLSQDALDLLKEQEEQIESLKQTAQSMMEGITIMKQPEIVRCKGCINNGTSRCPCHYSGDPHIDWEPDDDWFCADGERKSE